MPYKLNLILLPLLILVGCTTRDDKSYDKSLSELDNALCNEYHNHRLHTVDSIKSSTATTPQDVWQKFYSLSVSYGDLDVDSALSYAQKAKGIAPDLSSLTRSRLREGAIYNGSLMMYKEACEIFDSITPPSSDSLLLKDYYTLGVQLFKNLEELAADTEMRQKYSAIKKGYRDSVLLLSANTPFIEANKLMDDGRYNQALRLLENEASQPQFNPSNGALYDLISQVYKLQGNKEKEIEYLAMASRADIVNGVREYRSLPRLAILLYEVGDLNRAYNYMQRSIEDAKNCNARVRLLDMASTMSVITDSYTRSQSDDRVRIMSLLLIALLLLGAVGVSLYYARRQNHLLGEARNRQEEANAALKNAGHVREKYVRHFMNLSLEYLEKLDKYRTDLFKIAAKRNFDLLYDAIRSTAYIDRESLSFYRNFDVAFLELYPEFVEEFNSLLRSEERIELRKPGELTTELRIFALMRLGICESSEIAKFLHCSQSTVYNYRTRFRAKAIDKEDFVRKTFGHTPNVTPTLSKNCQ